jgi:murein DD-endopeptidase MepM/ murein hydrolase activator NlpD
VRLFRRGPGKGASEAAFADETDAPLDRLLLRTPLAVRRVTSGFGLRRHPLLGYTRMHRGVDFAAAPGTPVLAAADGVVEDAAWAGGYGRRIRLCHGGGLETLYAHLSAWAPGVAPGRAVRQGQLIGWTGATGLVTGPHLHFEVIAAGEPIDPAQARPPAPALTPAERAAFEARKAQIEGVLAGAG